MNTLPYPHRIKLFLPVTSLHVLNVILLRSLIIQEKLLSLTEQQELLAPSWTLEVSNNACCL